MTSMVKSDIHTYEDYLKWERGLLLKYRWKKDNHEKTKKCSREWRRRNASSENLKLRERRKEIRDLVIWLLGNKCKECGFSHPLALQIDHVDGGGVQELRSIYYDRYLKMVLKSIERGEHKYQCLCANHNWIKKGTNHEVPRRLI